MMRRDLYYNYIGYPNVYKGGGFGNFFRGIGNWVSQPFNKTARYNASFQSNPDSYGSGEITNFNTTGNGTTDWGSMGGFATGQTSQNNITNPYQGTTMMEQGFAQTGTPTAETVDGNAFADISKSGKSEGTFTRGGGGVPWGAIIGAAGTNIANAFLDTEASTADRVAGALGIPALANQWRADTSKGDSYLKGMTSTLDSMSDKNYLQDASSTFGANNAVKLNNKQIISPISPASALPSLKDFKGNWWRNMGASVAQGAASGSAGGPWGAAGGALTGLFGSLGGLFGRKKRAEKAYEDFLHKRDTLMSAQQNAFNTAVKNQTLSNMQALANGNMSQRINDMANIRAYGGNLFDGGGDLTDEQQMVLADIQADPRILFTPKYSQWRDYIRRTSPDYLDRLYTSLPYEQQQDIYQNDREAWGALSNKAKGDFGGTQVRKKTDEVSPYVAGALGLVGAAPAMEAITMFPMLENGLNAYFGYEGVKNLPTAVADTYNYAKEGDWSRAGLSAGEAALDGMFIGNGIKGAKKLSELSGVPKNTLTDIKNAFYDVLIDPFLGKVGEFRGYPTTPSLSDKRFYTEKPIPEDVKQNFVNNVKDRYYRSKVGDYKRKLEFATEDLNTFKTEDHAPSFKEAYEDMLNNEISNLNRLSDPNFIDNLANGTYYEYTPVQASLHGGELGVAHYNPNYNAVVAGTRSGGIRMNGPHELRHRMQHLSDYEKPDALVNKAFTSTFDKAVSSKYGLSSVGSSLEKETTLLDTRNNIIGDRMWSEYIPLEEQIKIIDSKTDKEILKALEESNGYGYHYVKELKKNPKECSDAIKALRDALKYSAAITPPVVGGLISNNNNNIEYAMGGNLYTDLSPNMMNLWNNKQTIDQQKVNMQQMNFGLGNSFNYKNMFPNGGQMDSLDLPNNAQYYANGGTHEENPYGGIQVGVDQQGNPNLVEEGEFRWGDYIFSDRINVDPTLLSRYNLAPATRHQGKKANKGKLSYADMAKKYAKKNKELANDPIGKNTLEAYMKRLQDAQEDQKFQDSMEQQKQDAINQYRKILSTPQQGNPMYGAMKYNGMGNAATQQGVNAGMSDLGQQGSGNEVLSNTNRSGNNMLHAMGGNLFWDGGTPQIKPKLLNVNPNLVLGDNYMNSWTANNAGTPRLFSSTTPMYIGENPEANFTAYQKRYPTLPSDAKGMQQLLVNEGYDIGNTGQNKDGVDGIWGNKSQAAWYDFLRAYNGRPNTINQYDLIGSNNQPSTSNSQTSYSSGLNLGVRDGDATTDANNSGNGQTSYGNAERNTGTNRSSLTDGIKRDTTTTFGTAAVKEDPKQVPHYSTSGEYAMFGKGFTPMLYDWMNKTNFRYDPNQRPAYELADMGNNSTFLRTADTIGGYRAPNLMDAERMNNAAQAQGLAALQAALSVGNGNRAFAANQVQQQGYNTGMSVGNNYATTQQANNEERYKTDAYNTAIDQFNANARNTSYQDNQKARQIGQQMALDAKKSANDYILRNELYADATNRQAMDNRAANQATWTDNALNYFIAQAQKNDILNAKNNDITNPYWTDKNGVMHYIGDSGLNSAIYDAFTSGDSEWGNYAVNNGTFSGDRLKAWNALQEKYSAADLKAHPELWKSLVLQEKQARKEEADKAELAKTDRLNNQRYAFDNNMTQLNSYRTLYGDKFTDGQWYDDLMKRYNDAANAKEFNDVNNLEYWNRVIGDKLNYWQRYNTPVTAQQSAYGGYINNNSKSNKREYYNYMRR